MTRVWLKRKVRWSRTKKNVWNLCNWNWNNLISLNPGAFDEPEVIHVEGEVDPVRDLDIISEELRLKDEDTLLKNLDKVEKLALRGNDKKLKPEYVSKAFYS